MVVPVNPVGIAPGVMKPLEPQAFYVVSYQLGTSSFLIPGPSEWPLTPGPPRLDQTWTWRQVHMLGQDRVPGQQIFDLPQRGPPRLPFYGTEWRQVGMLGRDQLPPGKQVFDLPVRAAKPIEQTWVWTQVDMLGLDQLPFGDQSYDRQMLPPRGAGQTWVLNLLQTTLVPVVVTTLPFNQYDWPLPRISARIDQTWVWNQTPMFGQDVLPENQYDWPLPRAPYRIEQTWIWRQVGMLGQDVLPKNQFDWPVPQRPSWYRSAEAGPLPNLVVVQYPFNQYDWPLTRTPGRIDETWTWRQVGMLGQDQLPVGDQSYDLTPKSPPRLPYYGTEWRQVGMLGQDRLPTGDQITDLTSHRYIPFRLEQTWTWRQVGMLGKDQLPTGQQVYDLTPKPAPRSPYYGTEWRQVGMLGQDRMLVGDQIYDLPVRAPLRPIDLYTWIQSVNLALNFQPQFPIGRQVFDLPIRALRLSVYDWIQTVNLALTVPPGQFPLNQYDWPLPRAPQQPALSWTWRQTGMLGKDILPHNQFDWPLPNRGPLRASDLRTWVDKTRIQSITIVKPFSQTDWPLPSRGPAQFDRSFTFKLPSLPPTPIGASYFLLQPHYVNDALLPAWTIVTEGREVPFGWIPTLMVDPLNTQAVAAFYAAGPRRGYQGPGYDWQGYQFLDSRRAAAIQSPATHWTEVSPGMFKLTGLGSSFPPVGG